MRRLQIALLSFTSLSACAFLKQLGDKAFTEPTINFKEARLQNVSLGSATVDLVYSVRNPNPIGLSLAEVTYSFSIEGKEVVAGTPPQGLHIPAEGVADLEFPASVKYAALASALEVFLSKDSASYQAKGEVGIASPIGVLRLPLSKEGQLEVPKIPKLEFGSPRVSRLSAEGATLDVPITVTNRNSYPLPIQSLSGALQIAGATVGNVSSGEIGQLEGSGSRQITLPVGVHFAQAAQAVARLKGASEIGFSGEVASGDVSIPIRHTQVVHFQQ
jgi:LEA14-like dessication related protein